MCMLVSVTLQVQYSLLSAGPAQSAIKSVADDLGVTLIAYSPLALGLLTGKYSDGHLPKGPRGTLFKQLLPGISPVTSTLAAIAGSRRKTMSQVSSALCCIMVTKVTDAAGLAMTPDVIPPDVAWAVYVCPYQWSYLALVMIRVDVLLLELCSVAAGCNPLVYL